MLDLMIEVDENNNELSLRSKSDFSGGKRIHRGSCLILINGRDEILLQKRSSNKSNYPNCFDFSVSGTLENESYLECMTREMREELDIELDIKEVGVFPIFIKGIDKSFQALFIGKTDTNEFNFNKDEISGTVWMKMEDVIQRIKDTPDVFSPHFRAGFKLFLDR